MMNGDKPDWAADPPVLPEDWTAAFRSSADDLIHRWHQREDAGGEEPPAGMQTGGVRRAHLGSRPRRRAHRIPLDPEVAERGLAFLSQGLTPDNRGGAFGAEVDVPADATVYDRLAAFAGRDPSGTP